MAYGTMWAHLVVVSAPILQLFGRIRKRQEPVCVQAFYPEATVKGLDIGIVSWLSRTREVERDALGVGPQIEVARHEFRALIDSDRLRIAYIGTDLFQRPDHILCPIAEAWIEHRHVTRERVDDGQDTDLLSGRKLIVNEV